MLPTSAQQSSEKLRSWLSAPLIPPCHNVQWVPLLSPQTSGNCGLFLGTESAFAEFFCYSFFRMSKQGRDEARLPWLSSPWDYRQPQPAAWRVPRINCSISSQICPLFRPVHRFILFPRNWEPWGSPVTQGPHRPLGSHPGSWRGLKCFGYTHTLRLLPGCMKRCRECQRRSTRQKLIIGDISPDSGAALAISSNSVVPSIKAYCPLMGNLQTEFDFFIKNQQAVGEKESPGSSPAPPCPSPKVFHHLSPRQPAWEDLYQLFNESCCCYFFFFPGKRKSFWPREEAA